VKIVLVGATGTIGRAVAQSLAGRHEVVGVGNTSGDLQVDIASKESIRKLFETVGPFDALVSAAGFARFGGLEALTDEDFEFSLHHKLMGQVNLVRVGLGFVRDGGSFTLTSGVLSDEPMNGSSAISMVNAGLNGFAKAAALDAPRGVRINVVSPPWVTETLEARGMEGLNGLSAAQVARAYVASVEGDSNGAVLDARSFA
jgi:NAD(P)-dependent dehydrogenase (short-subunit alcohol dehydrogenase family)